MNAELLRQRQQFLKRAAATPVIENHRPLVQPATTSAKSLARSDSSSSSLASSSSKKSRTSIDSSASSALLNYKSYGPSSQYKFAILHKILNYMKKRHLEGDSHGLTIDEILEETKQFDISTNIRSWLNTDALRHNPKIKCVGGAVEKYAYKPPYNTSTRKDLLRLLDRYDQKGYGGVMQEDVMESLPNADKHIKFLEEKSMIVIVPRPQDKKKVLFYNDRTLAFTVDEEMQKLWRAGGSGLEGLDDDKIEEYLVKSGHTSVKSVRPRTMPEHPKRKQRKGAQYKKLNDHMQDILEDYSHLQK